LRDAAATSLPHGALIPIARQAGSPTRTRRRRPILVPSDFSTGSRVSSPAQRPMPRPSRRAKSPRRCLRAVETSAKRRRTLRRPGQATSPGPATT